jgi:hypothetical protein
MSVFYSREDEVWKIDEVLSHNLTVSLACCIESNCGKHNYYKVTFKQNNFELSLNPIMVKEWLHSPGLLDRIKSPSIKKSRQNWLLTRHYEECDVFKIQVTITKAEFKLFREVFEQKFVPRLLSYFKENDDNFVNYLR